MAEKFRRWELIYFESLEPQYDGGGVARLQNGSARVPILVDGPGARPAGGVRTRRRRGERVTIVETGHDVGVRACVRYRGQAVTRDGSSNGEKFGVVRDWSVARSVAYVRFSSQ